MPVNPSKTLKVISWNANGISNKYDELEFLCQELNLDVICIQESRLNKRKPRKIPNYYHLNKPHTTSGGLITYYKRTLTPITIDTNTTDSETQAFKINDTTIVNYYNTHNTPINTQELQTLLSLDTKVVIIGDFNAKHMQWNCFNGDQNGRRLYNYIQNSNTVLSFPQNSHTYFPSRNARSSTIDLILNKNCTLSEPIAINALDSDHLPISFTLSGHNIHNPTQHKRFKVYTDWKVFKSKVHKNLTLNPHINTLEDIDREIDNLTSVISKSYKQASTRTQLDNYKLQLPPNIINTIKHKNKIRRQLQQNYNPNIHQQYIELKNITTSLISSLKTDRWEKFTRQMSDKNRDHWRIFKKLKTNGQSFGVSTLHGPQGLIFDDKTKANHIAESYVQAHSSTQDMSDRQTHRLVDQTITAFQAQNHTTPQDAYTTPQEIHNIIRKTNNKKAPGQDHISNRTLKELPRKAKIQLYYILNSCLKLQYFPSQWKNAIILPFVKPNKDARFASNYRPISLLTTMSKILEKLILTRLQKHEKQHNIIIQEQYGFRKSHSTTLQLANITNQITQNYNLNKVTAVLSLDIEKAFDTVWHDGLIYKLTQTNIPTYITQIIISYLKNRSFQVKIGKDLSDKNPVPAGVPQGGLLSPILFSLYINDIPKCPNTSLVVFADDTGIVAESWQANMANQYLQNHVNILEEYYDKWKIKINPTKTTLTHFTVKRKEKATIPVTFYGQNIQEQNELKYLGLHLDKKLSFTSHTNKSLRKANIALSCTFPLLSRSSRLKTPLKLRLYNQGIKPILLYANPVWSKTCKSNYNKLQKFQNKVLRIIHNKPRHTPIQELHDLANTPKIKDIIHEQTHKFYNYTTRVLDKTKSLGTLTPENSHFKIKHKLIHHLILD